MARAEFPCAECGASITVGGTSYNRARADRYARYCQQRGDICQACLQKRRAAESAAALEASAEMGLPVLIGSSKQIARASTIRLAALPLIDGAVAALTTRIQAEFHGFPVEAQAEVADALALIGTEMRAQTASDWWITECNADRYTIECRVLDVLRKRLQFLAPTAYAAYREENR